MSVFLLGNSRSSSIKSLIFIWLLPVLGIFLTDSSRAQDASSLTPISAPEETKWISGPAKAALGAYADIEVPQGYRFVDADGARSLLNRMNNPVPPGLTGILAPESGEWFSILEFNEVGYVKETSKNQIDSASVLKGIRDRNERQNKGQTSGDTINVSSIDWMRQPLYDGKDHSLEWAIRAETQSGKVINQTLVLFSRRGVLDVTVIRPDQGSSDLLPLKDLMKNITFKQGQSFADYKNGDKLASLGLAELIINDEKPASNPTSTANTIGQTIIWVYSVFFGGIFLLGGFYFFKKLSTRRHVAHTNGKLISPAKLLHENGSDLNHLKSNGHKTERLSNRHHHSLRRKRVYNYHKFYTNMILELYSPSYTGTNFTKNGDSNNRAVKVQSPPNAAPQNQMTLNDNLEFIANQKSLIDEQRRLMHQQTKLIEEKNQLIDEQNELLQRQSEMMENQFSLKLS